MDWVYGHRINHAVDYLLLPTRLPVSVLLPQIISCSLGNPELVSHNLKGGI